MLIVTRSPGPTDLVPQRSQPHRWHVHPQAHDGAPVIAASVDVWDEHSHQGDTPAPDAPRVGCSPAAPIGDDDQDVVDGPVRLQPHQSRPAEVAGIGVFGGVGDRLIHRQDQVLDHVRGTSAASQSWNWRRSTVALYAVATAYTRGGTRTSPGDRRIQRGPPSSPPSSISAVVPEMGPDAPVRDSRRYPTWPSRVRWAVDQAITPIFSDTRPGAGWSTTDPIRLPRRSSVGFV